ncbi:MAG: hypothetical protein JXR94_16290, partial [Candidatus Hydrogenedentes bacterium]|nr:hypothetical protein [Candidatus Hydrogenedentota bacterium]
KRYAEALAIFSSLAERFPGDHDINQGRMQCLKALQNPMAPALEHKSETHDLATIEADRLDEETVKKVILQKLLHGNSDLVQLRAAELAARVLGMVQGEGRSLDEILDAWEAMGARGKGPLAGLDAEEAAEFRKRRDFFRGVVDL